MSLYRYVGPDRKGWRYEATYELQVRRNGPFQMHVGTIASGNEARGLPHPRAIRIRTLRRFTEWFKDAR